MTPDTTVRVSLRPRAALLVSSAAMLLCACIDTTGRPRDGNSQFHPLEPGSRVRIPDPADGAAIAIESGFESPTYWSHANAILETEPDEPCRRLMEPRNVANTRVIDGYDTRPLESGESGFVIMNRIRRAFVAFDFEITWRIRRLAGEVGDEGRDPVGCEAVWDLTLGPELLRHNRGWLRISQLAAGLSLLEMQHELNAPRVDGARLERYLRDLAERLGGDADHDDD